MRSVLFICVLLAAFAGGKAQRLDGSWEGKITISPEMALRLVINIKGDVNEAPTVTMDSPDQSAYGIPMQIVYIDADSLNVSVPQIGFSYKGRLENGVINGEFSQGLLTLPLSLKPKEATLNRPQTPLAPFPYVTEEVSFPSALDDASLYGTLSLPAGEEKVAGNGKVAVVLISGSGTQNRDEEIFGHKPFAVIADYLARNGIASLRYDDRGFDPSTGLTPNSNTLENAKDALGAVQYLKKRGFSHVGLIGHSEGGLIADMIASQGNDVDFVVELGGPSVPGDIILISQNEFLLHDGKMPEEYIAMYIEAMKGLFNSQKDIDPTPFNPADYEIFSDEWSQHPVVAPLQKNLRENFTNLAPWLRYFINYDPIVDIKKISVPMLFLYCARDFQVPPVPNVPVLENEYPQAAIKVYKDLNHLMQHCTTGKVTEYAEIEETISPEVLDDIKAFIYKSANKD